MILWKVVNAEEEIFNLLL